MDNLQHSRGSDIRRRLLTGTLAALVLLSGNLAAFAQDSKKLPPAEKILAKTIKAQGGQAAFEKLHARVSTGRIEFAIGEQKQGGSITSFTMAPNLRYYIVRIGSVKIEGGSNGTVHWQLHSAGGAKIYEGDDAADMDRRARFNALLYWDELYAKVETVGRGKVDGHSCYKVVLTPSAGQPITRYYDRKTGLPIRVDTVTIDESGETKIQTRLEDYRELDGVLLPHKTVRSFETPMGTQTITTTWQSIKHNTEIPAARFEPVGAASTAAKKKGGKD